MKSNEMDLNGMESNKMKPDRMESNGMNGMDQIGIKIK